MSGLADLLLRIRRRFHLSALVIATARRCVWTIGARRDGNRRQVLAHVRDDWRLIARLLLPVATCALLYVRVFFVLLLFCVGAVHGRTFVDELAECLLPELGRHVLLIVVQQVANTVTLLEQQLLRILIKAVVEGDLVIFEHIRATFRVEVVWNVALHGKLLVLDVASLLFALCICAILFHGGDWRF